MEIRIERYDADLKDEWDNFVDYSKNGTFLIYRDFMEYHAHRFTDSSLMFYNKNKLIALLPANIADNVMYSHQGLTYGGLILGSLCTTKMILDIFDSLKSYLKKEGIKRLVYKAVPHIYHKLPAEEDLYALFRNNARLVGRSVSSCIIQKDRIRFTELRRRGIQRAEDCRLTVKKGIRFRSFWKILTDNLVLKYNVAPVHSVSEIEYLKSIFPTNIHLFEVWNEQKILGGCVIFDTGKVAHVQYISASDEGKECGALDYLFNYLIQKIYVTKPYFDFGTSTEKNGVILNEGLIFQKEGFGGRGIVYDTYELDI
ncbi:MAG TPA: GNAT family N-acetyltransferase [Dysgonomonas sp.]|nr:GNAT family N-acetyltransferase [Dysgonomonas sp.]